MNSLKITPISALDDNYIWCIQSDQCNGAVVVDPGDAEAVMIHLNTHKLALTAILITHHHYDHTDGIDALINNFLDIPVYGPANSPCTKITHPLHENDNVTVFDTQFNVLSVPGHTLDHIAYYAPAPPHQGTGLLFCGDTLFLAGCGRVFEGTHEQMHRSMQKLMALPKDTLTYPTHEYSLANLAFAQAVEPHNIAIQSTIESCQVQRDNGLPTLPTSLATEARINPFVRCHEPTVQAAVRKHNGNGNGNGNGKSSRAAHAVFGALREWKNNV